MEKSLLSNKHFLKRIFDAIPSMVLIMDYDVRVVHLNTAASKMLKTDASDAYMMMSGDALHCVNATAAPEGCGHAGQCGRCVIRNSVAEALRGGTVSQQKTAMHLLDENNNAVERYLLVTASPFMHSSKSYVLLILEDISELTQLRGLLPICASCKNIRDDKGYWNRIESYISKRSEAQFTHGLCPDCVKKLYPEYVDLKEPFVDDDR